MWIRFSKGNIFICMRQTFSHRLHDLIPVVWSLFKLKSLLWSAETHQKHLPASLLRASQTYTCAGGRGVGDDGQLSSERGGQGRTRTLFTSVCSSLFISSPSALHMAHCEMLTLEDTILLHSFGKHIFWLYVCDIICNGSLTCIIIHWNVSPVLSPRGLFCSSPALFIFIVFSFSLFFQTEKCLSEEPIKIH